MRPSCAAEHKTEMNKFLVAHDHFIAFKNQIIF